MRRLTGIYLASALAVSLLLAPVSTAVAGTGSSGSGPVSAVSLLGSQFEGDVVGQIQLQQFDARTARTTPATLTPSAEPWTDNTISYAVTGGKLLMELKLFDGDSGTLATGRISLSTEASSLETKTTTPATLTGKQAEEIEHFTLLMIHTWAFVVVVGVSIFLAAPEIGVPVAAEGVVGIIIEVKELAN